MSPLAVDMPNRLSRQVSQNEASQRRAITTDGVVNSHGNADHADWPWHLGARRRRPGRRLVPLHRIMTPWLGLDRRALAWCAPIHGEHPFDASLVRPAACARRSAG